MNSDYALITVLLLLVMHQVVRCQTFGDIQASVPAQLQRGRATNVSVRAYIVGLESATRVKMIASDTVTLQRFGNVDLSLFNRRDPWFTFNGTVTPLSSCPVDQLLAISWRFVRLDISRAFGPVIRSNVTIVV